VSRPGAAILLALLGAIATYLSILLPAKYEDLISRVAAHPETEKVLLTLPAILAGLAALLLLSREGRRIGAAILVAVGFWNLVFVVKRLVEGIDLTTVDQTVTGALHTGAWLRLVAGILLMAAAWLAWRSDVAVRRGGRWELHRRTLLWGAVAAVGAVLPFIRALQLGDPDHYARVAVEAIAALIVFVPLTLRWMPGPRRQAAIALASVFAMLECYRAVWYLAQGNENSSVAVIVGAALSLLAVLIVQLGRRPYEGGPDTVRAHV
jgi:hypothetical protein